MTDSIARFIMATTDRSLPAANSVSAQLRRDLKAQARKLVARQSQEEARQVNQVLNSTPVPMDKAKLLRESAPTATPKTSKDTLLSEITEQLNKGVAAPVTQGESDAEELAEDYGDYTDPNPGQMLIGAISLAMRKLSESETGKNGKAGPKASSEIISGPKGPTSITGFLQGLKSIGPTRIG